MYFRSHGFFSVPGPRESAFGAVLTHEGNGDAVGQGDVADLQRGKKFAHKLS